MRCMAFMLITLCLPLPVAASHVWADIDLCEVHKDKLPSGLTAESLPDPQSPGAALLHQYCTQCHNLPGPDRHTAAEWRDVTSKMFMLMDVSHRFGGLMGRVEIMPDQEQAILLTYLQEQAVEKVNRQPEDKTTATRQWLALAPFLILMGIGLVRWWRRNHRKNRPCV